MRCPLCEQNRPDQDRTRYFELELCRGCFAGQVELPLQSSARSLEVHYKPANDINPERHPARIDAVGTIRSPSQARLRLSRRAVWHDLLELVTGVLHTGDDIFDGHIAVLGGRDDASKRLLQHESVRASALECTTTGYLGVRNGTVRCVRVAPDLGHQELNETTRAVLIVMHYLQR